MSDTTFSILITTKNRKADLAFTLNKISYLLNDEFVKCVVFDDGSTDGTYEYVKENFPDIQLLRNTISKGYLYCRNKMLNETKADYAVSLDDDAHFVTENPLEFIKMYFERNAECGLLALRIFWGLEEPVHKDSEEKSHQVQSFVGCAHVWRMKAWHTIPDYPEWFVFYGEESFASCQLYKQKWKVQYFPDVLVNHRVDVKSRKNNTDYTIRLRRSLRADWYIYFLFFPITVIPRLMAFSLWVQFRQKVIKGDVKALYAVTLGLFDLFLRIPKIIKNANRLTKKEYENYIQLPETKIYWRPKNN